VVMDENGSDIFVFYISSRIWIRIRIVSAMPDRKRLDVDIINMRFEYSDTDSVSDVEYPGLDTDIFKLL